MSKVPILIEGCPFGGPLSTKKTHRLAHLLRRILLTGLGYSCKRITPALQALRSEQDAEEGDVVAWC